MKQSQFPLFLSWFIASPSKYFWRGDRQWRKSGIMFARVSFCQCYSYSLILNIFLMLCSLVSLSQCGSPLVPQQCLCHGAPPPHPTPPLRMSSVLSYFLFLPQMLYLGAPLADGHFGVMVGCWHVVVFPTGVAHGLLLLPHCAGPCWCLLFGSIGKHHR